MSTILADNKKRPGAAQTARVTAQEMRLPCGNDPTYLGPLLRELAARAAAEMKDKSYRRSPVGETVGQFIDSVSYARDWKTADSYESVLAKLAQTHDDFAGVDELAEQPELLERFLALNWGKSAEKTRAHHWTVLNLFFKWCLKRRLVPSNPMDGILKPRNPKTRKERRAYGQDQIARLIDAQPKLRDRAALGLLRLALRQNDLTMLQLQDIDLVLDQVHLNHAKGGQRHVLPIVFEELRSDLAAHLAERTLEAGVDPGAEYLLYGRERRHQPMNRSSVHRWFKGCLQRAGLPETIEMHEMRHTAGDHVWRSTKDIVMAQKLLRHESPATTFAYLHPTDDDLRAGLRVVEEADRVFHMLRSGIREDD